MRGCRKKVRLQDSSKHEHLLRLTNDKFWRFNESWSLRLPHQSDFKRTQEGGNVAGSVIAKNDS